jgi:6-phosphogluconolactonase (cycloisomerase 2 family)
MQMLFLIACGDGSGSHLTPPSYTVGGTVSGLATGQQVVLTNNSSDSLTVTANGAFTFSTPVAPSTGYSVVVGTQPKGQICTVSNGSASSVTANVTSVAVACSGMALYAYVVNNGDNTVSQYTIGTGGVLAPMSTPTVMTGTFPESITVDPTGHYAYVANLNDNTVSQYTITAGGALTPNTPATVATGTGPWAVTLDAAGQYAYVLNSVDSTISQYTIGAGGALTAMSPATVMTGTQPWSITLDSTGHYAYVANHLDTTVSQYAVGATGALTPLSAATVTAGTRPSGIAVDPVSLHAFVANLQDNTISQYSIGSNGALSAQNPATVAVGSTEPVYIAVDPRGNFAYVVDYAAGNAGAISQFTIDSVGGLTPMAAPTVATGKGPAWIAFNGTGQYAYVTNISDNTVSQFAIGSDGSLTPLVTPTVPTGVRPFAIATVY